MAAASYTTDISTAIDEANNANWVEPTAVGWTNVSSFNSGSDTDNFIQGTTSTSCAQANKTGVGGIMTGALAAASIPADGAVLIWCFCSCIGVLENESAGGYRVIIGNDTANFYGWNAFGKDTQPYSGWVCIAVNPGTGVTRDYTAGSPSGSWTRFGAAWNITVTPSRGFPFAVDCVRGGRCDARFAGGTTPDSPCTFAGFAALNDAAAARWGLIQAIAGGYLWQGLMTIGYGAACRFTDANVNISIANTKKVTAGFNKIEIRNASTQVNWTSINFIALGTVSRGNLEVVDDCDVNISASSFAGMGTFVWKAASDILASAFRGCQQITANGANFSGTVFSGYEGAANTSYLLWNTNVNTSGKLNGCAFTKGAAATHAVEIADSGLTAFTLVNVAFNGYNASNNQNDSALHIKKADGVVTITIQGGTTPSYRSDGATVDFVTSSVDVAVTAKDINGSNVVGARIFLKASEGGHGLPFEAVVTIVNSGTTATVSHTGHGMKTNDKVLIDGASHWQNNGVFAITRIDDDSYSYTLPSAPGSNPTGTIKATFVALEGLSGADGSLSTSRSYSATQPVVGWVRKSSSQPYYKPAPLGGSVSSSSGYSATAVMISDE